MFVAGRRGSGVKRENRGRRPRFPFKGGEEKSPYSPNFSIRSASLLDGECTIALFLGDNVTPSAALRSCFRKGKDIAVEVAEVKFLCAIKGGVKIHDDLDLILQSFVQVTDACRFDIKCL